MAFKINVGFKGKTFKVESDAESLIGKYIGDKVEGKEVAESLTGYELEITGTSDKAGFPGLKHLPGPNLKKVLLSYETGMKRRPKGEDKKYNNKTPKGLRLRKTVRGKEISPETVQINIKVLKEGSKKFEALFEKPVEEAGEKKE